MEIFSGHTAQRCRSACKIDSIGGSEITYGSCPQKDGWSGGPVVTGGVGGLIGVITGYAFGYSRAFQIPNWEWVEQNYKTLVAPFETPNEKCFIQPWC